YISGLTAVIAMPSAPPCRNERRHDRGNNRLHFCLRVDPERPLTPSPKEGSNTCLTVACSSNLLTGRSYLLNGDGSIAWKYVSSTHSRGKIGSMPSAPCGAAFVHRGL